MLSPSSGYGIGTVTDDRNGVLWHGHTGGMPGYFSVARYLDAHDRGYVALFNVRSGEHERTVQLLEDPLTRDVSPPLQNQRPSLPTNSLRTRATTSTSLPATSSTTLTEVYRVTATEDGLTVTQPLSGRSFTLTPVGDGRFFTANDPVATHAFVTEGDATYLQFNGGEDGTFERTSTMLVWARWGVLLTVLALMASSLLFALIWGPQALVGRIRPGEPLQVRAWPLLSSLSFVVFAAAVVTIMSNPSNTDLVGEPNVYSLAVTIGSVLHGVFAGVGLVEAFRYYGAANRLAWWHSTLVSGPVW